MTQCAQDVMLMWCWWNAITILTKWSRFPICASNLEDSLAMGGLCSLIPFGAGPIVASSHQLQQQPTLCIFRCNTICWHWPLSLRVSHVTMTMMPMIMMMVTMMVKSDPTMCRSSRPQYSSSSQKSCAQLPFSFLITVEKRKCAPGELHLDTDSGSQVKFVGAIETEHCVEVPRRPSSSR